MTDKINWLLLFVLISFVLPLFAQVPPNIQPRLISPFERHVPVEIDFGNNTQSEIKLLSQMGFIFVEVFLNQQGPFRFLVDTGADISIISEDLVKKLNMTAVQTQKRVFQTAHNQAEIDTFLYMVEQLKMGDIHFKQVPFVASNTASDDFQLLKDLNVLGIMGANLFYDIVLTLNLPQQKMFLSQHGNATTTLNNSVKFNHEYYLPIIKTTVIHGKEKTNYDFLIDTGYTGFVKMPICFPYAERHNQNDIMSYDIFKEPDTGFLSELDGIWMIGTNKIENPMVKYSVGACRQSLKWGLIGTQFLTHHVVTIDQHKREIILH